jgi:hypothetical protein
MWLITVGILFVSGILYYVFARSMPPIVLGITIACGAVLLFYIIRLIREKLRDNAYYRHMVEHMSSEELDRTLKEPTPWEDYTCKPMYPESEVVSTEKVICRRISGEVHTAVLLVHKDGTINVKCRGECYDCEYGDVE